MTGKQASRRPLPLHGGGSGRGWVASGFTLVELLVVLSIIALLTALVAPALVEKLKPARRGAARAQIENFVTALDSFALDLGRYPSRDEGLKALWDRPEGQSRWKGPYLKKEVPKDPWGRDFVYRVPGPKGPYEVLSFGADGREGGEGENRDIVNWTSE